MYLFVNTCKHDFYFSDLCIVSSTEYSVGCYDLPCVTMDIMSCRENGSAMGFCRALTLMLAADLEL